MAWIKKAVLPFGSCLFAVFVTLPAQATLVLRLAANDWEPYTGKSRADFGIASKVVVTALKRASLDATIEIMPWNRVLILAYNGKVDGVISIWSTKERRSKLIFSHSYMSNRLVLLHMPGSVGEPKSLQELHGVTLGIGSGYGYSDEFFTYSNFKVESVPSVLQNLLKLTAGRVDMVLEDKLITKFAVAKFGRNNPSLYKIIIPESTVLKIPLYFALNPNVPRAGSIMAAFNEEISKMAESGELSKLLSGDVLVSP